LTDYIASVDAGNGGVNAVIAAKNKSGYKAYYEPSVRAAATGDFCLKPQPEYADRGEIELEVRFD